MNRKLNYGGPLKSDYAFLCPDKLEPREDEPKAALDYATPLRQEIMREAGKPKTGRFAWLRTLLNYRMEA